jgi:hypothetical protein
VTLAILEKWSGEVAEDIQKAEKNWPQITSKAASEL